MMLRTMGWVGLCVLGLAVMLAPQNAAAVRLCLSGSNTVGETLAPALVRAWAEQQDFRVSGESRPAPYELRLQLASAGGSKVVDVLAHGTSTGFAALRDGQCDLWMASRAVRPGEIEAARAIGRLYERGQEHVIALDGLAVIVHPTNSIRALTIGQVRDLFAGRIRDWSRLGGTAGPVALHARDEASGTYDTFRSLVMGEVALVATSRRYESTEALARAVAADPAAIGFVGLAGVGAARTLSLSEVETAPLAPTPLAVATEDYLLSRRLMFYSAAEPSPAARSLLEFALGPAGQQVVRTVGFVPQEVVAFNVPAPAHGEYRELVAGARRIGLNFRFGEGAALLDNKALEDIERLVRFMRQPAMAGHELLLIGFADRSEITPFMALSLSNDRVDLVADALRREGLRVVRQRGLGQIVPVASNDTVPGRQRNRRVEVWVRPSTAAIPNQRAVASAAALPAR